jgi:cbb3-type cytochrome oxidase subunit 1
MARISDRFLQLGVVAALVGMVMGTAMGATQDFTLAPAHAHLNLLGWVSMMIYGLFYRAVPSAAQGRLPLAQFWLATLGVIVFVPSLVLELMGRREASAGLAVGSVLTVLSMVLFAVVVFGATRKRAAPVG